MSILTALKADLLGDNRSQEGSSFEGSSGRALGQNEELLHAIALVDAARLDPQGQGPMAIEYLSELIGRDPSNDRAWLLLGRAYSSQDESDRAELCYSISAKLAPSEPWSWVHRGIDRLAMRRYAEAESDLTAAIELDGNEPSHYLKPGPWQESDKANSSLHSRISMRPCSGAPFKPGFTCCGHRP